MELVFCPECNHELDSVYTSGIPQIYYDKKRKEKRNL